MVLGSGEIEGAPQNQTGGVNSAFNTNGTNGPVTSGVNFTPVNWFSVAPQPGVGAFYTITFTDTGLSSGTATTISNNNVPLSLASNQFPGPASGIGGRNFSYVIKDLSGTTVASGTGNTNNSI